MPRSQLFIAQSSRLLSKVRLAQKRPTTPKNFKSTSAVTDNYNNDDGASYPSKTSEMLEFATSNKGDAEMTPVLLDAKEHVVGYLSRILNARVYDAAIETELQHAKNLSAVSDAVCPLPLNLSYQPVIRVSSTC